MRETLNPDRRALIEMQRDLYGLNVLGHVLSRTRKREVAEDQPLRSARVYTIERPINAGREGVLPQGHQVVP